MSILREVPQELLKMFLVDARLSASILALVAFVAVLMKCLAASSLVSGSILLAGSLAILVMTVLRYRLNLEAS